mmetsp:Transcript_18211/g.45247  ORF Transcript_18211/g.45247 Transcript_18211/m.45247 type:complete len:86 (-) Transcript_18211:116-373(-)
MSNSSGNRITEFNRRRTMSISWDYMYLPASANPQHNNLDSKNPETIDSGRMQMFLFDVFKIIFGLFRMPSERTCCWKGGLDDYLE